MMIGVRLELLDVRAKLQGVNQRDVNVEHLSCALEGEITPRTGNVPVSMKTQTRQTRALHHTLATSSTYGVMSKLCSYMAWMRSISSSFRGAWLEASANSVSCSSS